MAIISCPELTLTSILHDEDIVHELLGCRYVFDENGFHYLGKEKFQPSRLLYLL
jgi:hypothetical protein